MDVAAPSHNEIATALQRFCGFPAERAAALAAAGLADIRSPWSVPGMAALTERLVRALQRREHILLFGDFDADGVTGSAVLHPVLSAYSDRVRRYNPAYEEGYGLHADQVDRFAGQGVRVIITVDTGISSLEAVARARQVGLEVLITDHHLPLLDPGPPDTLWIDPPDHVLSGAQLAYLVAWAVRERMGGTAGHDAWGLALSAVGAQMDSVPVDEPETRAWVSAGLATINSERCPPGLRVLRDINGNRYVPSELRSLGGILNMAKRSRRVDANAIVEALLPDTPDERRSDIYHHLTRESERTRRAVEAVTAQAMADVRGEVGREGLLLYEVQCADATLTEVEGPLTSRIAAVTGRPTVVLRPSGEYVKFSGRARGAFSFETLLNDPAVRALVADMGGHRQAIGGSFRRRDQAAFVDALHRWAQAQPAVAAADPPRPPQALDALDPATAYLLGRAIGPFGHRLQPPQFCTELFVRGGWAGRGNDVVELDRPLAEGDWRVTFRFDEAGCDGHSVVLRVDDAQRLTG